MEERILATKKTDFVKDEESGGDVDDYRDGAKSEVREEDKRVVEKNNREDGNGQGGNEDRKEKVRVLSVGGTEGQSRQKEGKGEGSKLTFFSKSIERRLRMM
jgi:hypothetical protein